MALATPRRGGEDAGIDRAYRTARALPTRPGFRSLGALCLAVSTVWLLLSAPAFAQSAAPSAQASNGVRLSGSVTGSLKHGDTVTFRLRVTEPGGFRNLQLFQVTMLLHGLTLSEFTYLQSANAIAVRGSQLVTIGSPGVLDGAFFRFSGLDVTTQSSGNLFDLTIRSHVLQDVPPGADFQFSAVNQDGSTVSILRHLNIEEAGPKGFSWGTLALAVVAALFAGSFVGGLFASRRRRPSVSVYGSIKRRLDEQKAAR